jgi:hypothetical protein
MSSYFTLIAMLMLIMSPLWIPTAVTVVQAFGNWRKYYRATNQAIGQKRRALRPAV